MTVKTLQYTYNRIARHMLKQNRMSTNASKTICLYRGYKGDKCPIGCLIPNKDYRKYMEESSIEEGIRGVVGGYLYSRGYSLKFVKELKQIHDTVDPKNWKKSLSSFADSYSLKKDVLNEINSL